MTAIDSNTYFIICIYIYLNGTSYTVNRGHTFSSDVPQANITSRHSHKAKPVIINPNAMHRHYTIIYIYYTCIKLGQLNIRSCSQHVRVHKPLPAFVLVKRSKPARFHTAIPIGFFIARQLRKCRGQI